MKGKRQFRRWVSLCIGLGGLGWLGFGGTRLFPIAFAMSVEAHHSRSAIPTEPAQIFQRRLLEASFVPPSKDAPQATATSATRNEQSCGVDEPRIKALAPPHGYGLTLNPRPAITLELAETSARQVALVFQNAAGNLHGTAILPLPTSPFSTRRKGSTSTFQRMSFRIPATMAELEPNQRYRWSLVVMCGESVEPDDPTFMGWIERRERTPKIHQQLNRHSARGQARWYAQNGYWYDLVEQTD